MRSELILVFALVLLASPVAAETPDAYTAIYEREATLYQSPRNSENEEALRALIPDYETLAEAGDTRAMFRLANIAQLLGDSDSLLNWLRKLDERGHAAGQYYLASQLRKAPDCSEARGLLERSAAGGYEHATTSLAVFYEEGICGPKDDAEAAVWYEKAARMGIGVAQHSLGTLYDRGAGVRKNMVEAYAWLTIASLQPYKSDKRVEWDASVSLDYLGHIRNKLSDSDLRKAEARIAQLCGEDKTCSNIPESRRISSPLRPSPNN